MSNYLLAQGKVFIASRDANGKSLAQRWLGDVSAAKIGLKTNKVEQKESYSGQRATAKSITIGKEASVDLTLLEFSSENISWAIYGTSTAIASGSVTGEALPSGLLAGDRISLKYGKVSAVVVTDSAATPNTLDAAKYTIDANYGTLVFNDLTGMTQPLKVAYSHGALESVSFFSKPQEEVFLRYEGINLAEEGKPIIVELYRVSAEPLKDLALITDKFADMNVSAAVLIDSTKPVDAEIGQFGRIIQMT